MGVFLEEAKIQPILAEAEEALRPHADERDHAVFHIAAHIIRGTKL
jgi:hypothetical protein